MDAVASRARPYPFGPSVAPKARSRGLYLFGPSPSASRYIDLLLSGGLYFVVHADQYPGGELRGQIYCQK